MATSNSTPIYTNLTDVTAPKSFCLQRIRAVAIGGIQPWSTITATCPPVLVTVWPEMKICFLFRTLSLGLDSGLENIKRVLGFAFETKGPCQFTPFFSNQSRTGVECTPF